SLAYEYDAQNRLTAEHQGWGTLRYGYDACGQLQNLRLPDNNRLTFNHDKGGHLATVELNGAVLTSHLFTAGREQQRQQGQLLSTYQHDHQGRLFNQSINDAEGPVYRRHYDYDKSGNLTRLLDTRKGDHRYHYDPLSRLTRADHTQDEQERFGHDPAGNLLMQDRPGPDIVAGNRLMIQGDHHYDYDAFGNLIRERRGKGHQLVTEYRYDCQHRLIGIKKPNGQTASYRYDPFGRRISKTVDGITTEFFWQGDTLIAEHHENRHRSYLYEPDSFRPLALLDGFGPKETKPYHYQLDHLGTPQELTAQDGEIVWSAHYRAYGEITRLDIGKIDNPLRFQGQYFDPESGLHYNRHRYYNPDIGRYLTPDPVKLAGGMNAYQYVPNPTGWIDPLGLSANCPGSVEKKPTCALPAEPKQPDVSRKGAFREAKRDAKIPMTQHPDVMTHPKSGRPTQSKKEKMTDLNDDNVLDDNGRTINTRVYQFTRADGSRVLIQDHSAGHKFGRADGVGDQTAHFNLRPINKPRNGHVSGTKEHYNFRIKK
ncbi:RHS repeat-associated core domain-containing protein, partial [Pseudomonas sp. CHM02]|uniref:RHS repeat-associated core domain-containing protein n=1 Tax=Pseudomonas sp. CHM02 TaxID=1463662 RepID=UPI000470B113